ncbi:MAG: DUF2303 family protein [Nocardioidaceae bacterium]
MTELQPTIGTTGGDAQAIVDAATRAARPQPLGEIDGFSRFHSVVVPEGGEHVVVDLEDYLDEYRERPRRKTGTVHVHDSNSFVQYLDKHVLPETEVWADATRQQLVAVINTHMGTTGDGIEDYAGWGDHRVAMDLRRTPAWDAWTGLDRQLVDQNSFAEHLEDRLVDVVTPPGADMLELAQTFQATIGVVFESSKRLSSGERQLAYREDLDAKAGRRGQLEIPNYFTLGLNPFEGADTYKITARLRYRITDGHLRIGYVLDRPEDVLRLAFLDIVAAVETQVQAPVFRGQPCAHA